ncbi:MAG: class II glutamine amidotransferase [Magnetovibrionaceae bacterium]
MCELLGMSANVPTDITFSFSGLMERGGHTGPHKDGWGIAFYEGRACRSFRDPHPSAESEIAKLIQRYPIKSLTVISHIRKATHGKISLENTHPFHRELWGRQWTFAHNGKLKGIKKRRLEFYKPVGSTDSEHAFCWIMDNIRRRWPDKAPRPSSLIRHVETLAKDLHGLGIFNMLMSDSRHLFCFCGTNLHWITRKAPFGKASLLDAEMAVDFHQETTPNDIVSVVATKPLTGDETWAAIPKGNLLTLLDGVVVR